MITMLVGRLNDQNIFAGIAATHSVRTQEELFQLTLTKPARIVLSYEDLAALRQTVPVMVPA